MNSQIHNSPRWCSRNSLASFVVFPLILFLATGDVSETVFFLVVLLLVLLPIWVRLGRVAKSIEVTSEGLIINCYNNGTVHILSTDLIRAKIRPYKTLAGPRFVYIYSMAAKPVPFCDSISGYHDLLARIRQHVSLDAEQEPLAPAKEPIGWNRGVAGFVLLIGPLLALTLTIASAATWSSRPTAAVVLLLGAFAIPLIYAVVFGRGSLNLPL